MGVAYLSDLLQSLIDLIQDWAPVIYTLATIGIGAFIKLHDIAAKKRKEIDAENEAKNKDNYQVWKHEESTRVIGRIKDLCNFYKDKGKADSVSFVQLENGTVAKSRLCNMFVSCLAEDDRFSNLPKYMDQFQRIPYSKVSFWADSIAALSFDNIRKNMIATPDSDVLDRNASIRNMIDFEGIRSSIVAPVYDPNGVLIGAGIFLYSKADYNGMGEEEQKTLMVQFRTALESIFLEFYLARQDKMKEFHIKGGDL